MASDGREAAAANLARLVSAEAAVDRVAQRAVPIEAEAAFQGPARLPVVLTRPAGQNAALAARLRTAGREVLELPSLRLTPLPGPAPDPAAFDLVVFVSGNAVRFYLDTRQDAASGASLPWPVKVAAATVGPSSSAALRNHPAFGDAPSVIQPSPAAATFDSESLWTELAALDPMPRSALIVRGGSGPEGRGRDWLAARLRDAGVTVTIHSAYRREPAPWPNAAAATLRNWAAAGRAAVILITSKEGADAMRTAIQHAGLLDWYAGCRLIATHPRIASHVGDVHSRTVPATCTPAAGEPLLQISSPRDDDIFAAIESTP
ncbi:uroporphyrinogen III methyltransferase [Pigmentiphaga litoralis]|uniref:uroporphyrinogen-III synthase n=1 Tax=Pigmentiphaga litoralis TaxID=516702 RepID=UPI001676E492|nr:uroporphyrinogen-III synthase [Pigmentiphaga litoralis]GGX13184.1 uroporphyrinogen III methyltransferase [Pigmentiphaga litoralis]